MLVRFTKNAPAAAFDLLRCKPSRDSSHATVPFALPREAVLPHAAIQFVVESVLGWSDGYFQALPQAEPRSTRTRATSVARKTSPATPASQPPKTAPRAVERVATRAAHPTAAAAATVAAPMLSLPRPGSLRARQSAAIAACLQADQWRGPSPYAAFSAALAAQCRVARVTAPRLTAAQLAALRAEVRAFGAAWRPLAPGHFLEREFPQP